MFFILSFATIFFFSLFMMEVFRLVGVGSAGATAQANAAQQADDHQRYLSFRQERDADRQRIHEQVAAESRALEEQWAEQERAVAARRRLVPGWDLVGLLRQQGRISPEEYSAYCLDNTGEYCPAVVRD